MPCINQQDAPEKSLQVQMMRSIFLNAWQVVVWLGEEADAGRALETCRQWKNQRAEGGVDGDAPYRFMPKRYDSTTATREDFDACEALFSRPWWSRTWIIQEVIHDNPVRVLIGHLQVDLDDLIEFYPIYRSAMFFSSGRNFIEVRTSPLDERIGFAPNQITWDSFVEWYGIVFNVIQNISSFRRGCEGTEITAETGLGILLHYFRHQLATDPRDKVFAFLGMVTQCNTASQVRADYSDNASKQSVYTEAARSMLAKPLICVESPDHPVASSQGLPSWVPDFTTRRQTIATILDAKIFCADSGHPPDICHRADRQFRTPSPNQDMNCLRLIGIYIGVITGVVDTHVTRLVFRIWMMIG